MKIGIYGGTFNPIHLAHVHVLKGFIDRLSLEKVLIIPTYTPPHKVAVDLASFEDRYNMCALAAKEINGAQVLDIENKRKGKSYTYETLVALRNQYPCDEFYLITGEDMFLTFDKWKHFEIIAKLAVLCASPRSEDGLRKLNDFALELKKLYGAKSIIEDIRFLNISSTDIREKAKKKEDITELVPAEVAQYIKEKKVYV